MDSDSILGFIKQSFKIPTPLNWGYAVFFTALGTAVAYGTSLALFSFLPWSSTSLVGFSISSIILMLFAFAVPSVFLSKATLDNISGKFTGFGSSILALLSGVPVYLVTTSIYNLICYGWMRLGNSIVYPYLFSFVENETPATLSLGFLSGTMVPSICMCLMLTGLLWSTFKPSERRIAMIIIPLLAAFTSFDFIGIIGIFITYWWLCYVRYTTENIWGPVFCLIGSKLTGIIIGDLVSKVDITGIRTYQDVPMTCFYSALPAITVSLILFAFFMKVLGEFHFTYNNDIYGDTFDDEYRIRREDTAPGVFKGLNLAFFVGFVILLVIWVLIFRGRRP